MSNETIHYRLALSYLDGKGVGPATAGKLLKHFGDPKAIFKSPSGELRRAGASGKAALAITNFHEWDKVKSALNALDMVEARCVAMGESEYPEALLTIEHPPLMLYVQGAILPSDNLSAAMIGTRKPTDYGLRVARSLAEEAAACKVCVVSGLARGIDAACHEGALRADGGRTIAVLGCGIDRIYPPENASLARSIAQSGAVITEFFPGTSPKRENFPRRNRLIAGLSQGVLVIEAGHKSGTMITVDFAVKQGKPIFGVPGPIDSTASQGVHHLLRDGATPVFEAMDLMSALLPEYQRREGISAPPVLDAESWKKTLGLTGDASLVIEALSHEPRHVDEVASETGRPIQRLLTILLELELRGLVVQKPGKYYVLNLDNK